ncbi:MAG: hypothetical protein ACYSSI_02685 [Planctomycetota bacterium]
MFIILLSLTNCRDKGTNKEVVIYTSLDKVFSQPILDAFERQTGVKVKAVYDSEARQVQKFISPVILPVKSTKTDWL